jgi:hypothetical protein
MIRTSTLSNRFKNIANSVTRLVLLLILLAGSGQVKAQVAYNEGFDFVTPPAFGVPDNSLPFGWTQSKFCSPSGMAGYPGPASCADNDNYWDRMGTGATNAIIGPRTGNGMMRYRSFSITSGEKAYLSSKRLDMTSMSAPAIGSFYIYREGTAYTTSYDSINVFANTSPSMSGTPVRINAVINVVRLVSAGPAPSTCPSQGADGWYKVDFTIPNAAPFTGSSSVYVIIMGCSADGNNIYVDDFTVDTYPNTQQLFSSAAVIYQNTATTGPGNNDQVIIGMRVTVTGDGSPLRLQDLLFNTNGTTNPVNDIVNAKLYWTGGTNVFSGPGNGAVLMDTYNNPWATNFTMLTTPWTGLQNGDNFLWLTYNIGPINNTGDYVDAEWLSFKYSLQKTGVTGVAARDSILAPNNLGLSTGMTVSGTGIGAGATITTIASPSTYLKLSAVNTGAISGIITFTSPAVVPSVQTLAGARLIDIVYCIPTYTYGTSWLNYVTNDYIANVTLAGNIAPGINNSRNTNGPAICSPAPTNCPFSAHPPDYEYFPPVTNQTAALTAGSTYSISLKSGTYGSGNWLAAWIDYDKLNGFDPTEKIAQSPGMGASTVHTQSFTVPAGAAPGNTRLRVREVWIGGAGMDPCASYAYGETEDYVVTIIPTCAPAWPGWKTWLGFTNDWDNPANWCGGVPTINDDARIPGKGITANDRPGNFAPMIKTGVLATARNLRIETNDTIFVNATAGAALTVAQDMLFLNNTSAMIVNSTFQDTAQVSNGTLSSPTVNALYYPFKNIDKAKSIWLFTQADLLAEGLIAGDVVTNMLMHVVVSQTNNVPFKNATIKIYYTDGTVPGFRFQGASGGNNYLNMPPVIGPAPVTVFGPGDLYTNPALGTINIPMIPGAFVWNGSSNKLVIEMSYDNYLQPVPNFADYPKFTQTTGFEHYINIYSNKYNANYNGNDIVLPISSLPQSFGGWTITGSVGSNVIASTYPNARFAVGQWVAGTGFTVTRATGAVATPLGSLTITMASVVDIQVGHYLQGTGVNLGPRVTNIAGNVITLSNPTTAIINAATNLTFRPAITALSSVYPPYTSITLSTNVVAAISGNINIGAVNTTPQLTTDQYRPNITFKFDRPYNRFPITIRKNWTNNGLFTAGKSIVNFQPSPVLNQLIDGTSTTTFFDMKVNNAQHVTMNQNVIVSDTLLLELGYLKLNNKMITITNTALGNSAITRNSGYIQPETDVVASNVSPYGRVYWKMGSVPGTRVLPFVKASNGVGVFLDYNIDSGTHDPIIASYSTTATNLNIPTPVVSNILGYNPSTGWSTDGYAMVDRYYMIQHGPDSIAPQADFVFRYDATEQAQSGNTAMSAQRWRVNAANPIDSSRWEFPYVPGQVFSSATNSVTVNNFTGFANNGNPTWWTIVGTATPLPVTLLDFKATPFKDRVRLNWATGSEINSSHFIVERTVNIQDFSYIGRVESKGPSTNTLNYQTWDLNPVEGIQYYYLRQYDRDGRMETYGPVSAKFSNTFFDIVSASVTSNQDGLTVVFSYDSNLPYSYRIIDMAGRVIVAKDRNPAEPGMNVIDITTSLAKGVYQVILQNDEKVVSKKFFY